MKTAIGGVSLFQIVMLFLLLFTGIMCLTINHSKAFGVKDEIINVLESSKIETYNGYPSNITLNKIVDRLQEINYRSQGKCPSGYRGFSREGNEVSGNASFCLKFIDVSTKYNNDLNEECKPSDGCILAPNEFPKMGYYKIVVFYELNIPLISMFTNFSSKGTTKMLYGG